MNDRVTGVAEKLSLDGQFFDMVEENLTILEELRRARLTSTEIDLTDVGLTLCIGLCGLQNELPTNNVSVNVEHNVL